MIRDFVRRSLQRLALHLDTTERRTTVSRGEQLLLIDRWRERLRAGTAMPEMSDVEFRCFSQSTEDGILLFVLTMLGFGNRTVIELGCGDGKECNAANLLVNHGFTGLLVDGDPKRIARAREFYGSQSETRIWPPQVLEAFITRENVNDLVRSNGWSGDVDVLSIDLDGMDFWVWDALTVVSPRIVIVEANNVWGATESVAVPYSSSFVAEYTDGAPDYSGASLLAYAKLARRKGYRLVGAHRYGFNAVFVRDDEGIDLLPEVSVASCLTHPQAVHARTERAKRIVGRPLVPID